MHMASFFNVEALAVGCLCGMTLCRHTCIVPLLNGLCALQVSSALRNLIISSALQLSAACRATRTTMKLDVYGDKKCLLRSRTCVQGKSLDVNNVSSLITDEVFDV